MKLPRDSKLDIYVKTVKYPFVETEQKVEIQSRGDEGEEPKSSMVHRNDVGDSGTLDVRDPLGIPPTVSTLF